MILYNSAFLHPFAFDAVNAEKTPVPNNTTMAMIVEIKAPIFTTLNI